MQDAEMSAILRDNWDVLVGITSAGNRDSERRSEFNEKVASALEEIAKANTPKDLK